MIPTGEHPVGPATAIRRGSALHEASRCLDDRYPQCPRIYGVALLADVNERRWYPLDSVRTVNRLRDVFTETSAVADSRAAAHVLAARLTHEVLGRVLPLLLVDGRVWDIGLENLWVHFDSDNDIDWLAVVDPTMRVLPDDPWLSEVPARFDRETVVLPGESALTTWVAHRCHRTLAPLFVWIHEVSDGAVPIASMWQGVGSAVVMAAAQVARHPGTDGTVSIQRSQAVLDAMVGFGLPVRRAAGPQRGRLPQRRGYTGTGWPSVSGGTRVARA